MKKRFLAALIAGTILLSACAFDPGTLWKEAASRAAEEQKETDEREESGSDRGQSNESASIESEQSDAAGSDTDDYVRGITTDTGWESEFWNLRFTAPEGLYMMSEEGLSAIMGLSEDFLSQDYNEQQLAYVRMTTVYEMMCMNPTGDVNVIVTVEKLFMKNLSSEDYMKAALSQLTALKTPVYTILNEDGDNEAQIMGETYAFAKVKGEANNNISLQNYYCRVKDGRAISIIITYGEGSEDLGETILNSFETYSDGM